LAILTPVADEKAKVLESYLRMTEALLDAMDAASRGGETEDVWRFTSYKTYMRKANELIDQVHAVEPITAPVDRFDMSKVPSLGDTVLPQQRDMFEMARANLQILKAWLSNRVDPKDKQVVGIADFLQANLRRATLTRPEREKEVQDTIEQLFIGRGMEKGLDYDREVGRVKVSAKEVIPDFVLPLLDTAIEVKLLKEPTGIGRVIDEINADIQAYSKDYKTIVFVVYDLGVLRDEVEFRRDLESTDGIKVIVIKQ
jgi:hypothetical protein